MSLMGKFKKNKAVINIYKIFASTYDYMTIHYILGFLLK